MRLLATYHAIGKRIDPLRKLLWALAVGACLAFAIGLFRTPGTSYFLAALVVLLWSLLMIAMAQSFAQPPPEADESAGRLARLKVACHRAYLHLLAAATTILCAFVAFISLRAISLFARAATG